MQKIKVSKRIEVLMNQAALLNSHFNTIADIGTDHGYLPLIMFEHRLTEKGILCDINQGPLNHAQNTFKDTLYDHSVDFRLGSGIEPLNNNEAELVFIAGMGGNLIKEILEKNLEKSLSNKYYILQPMTEQDRLRDWLINNGFNILWDHFTEDAHKHYEIIVVAPKIKNSGETIALDKIQLHKYNLDLDSDSDLNSNLNSGFDLKDLEFGTTILKNQLNDYLHFLSFKEKKYKTIFNQIQKEAKGTETQSKIALCNNKLMMIQKIRENLL